MASENGISTAALSNEQLQAIRQVLIKKERPLSWKSFGQELRKCNPSFDCQLVQDAFCKKAVPGILSSRDFITLDTPRNVGLLKLQLVVAVNEKINGGRFSKANHYFHMIASDGEKDELGHNEDTLAKSFLEFDDVFHMMTSLSASVGSYKRVSLKPESALLHKSFFAFEKDKKTSAVHKVKYLLFLCHGITDTWSAFEFSRCFLTKEEKVFFARNTIAEFISALKSFNLSLCIRDNAVALSSSLLQKRETLIQGNGGQRDLLEVFDKDDIILFKDILQDGPLSWNCFLSILESRKPDMHNIALREMLLHSSPDGLMHSPDFISLCDIRSTALVKLHFLVTVNNKLGNGQLGKISHHFNVIAVDKEKAQFGRNSKMISKSLLKYNDIFHLPSDGGDRCNVKCGPLAIPFDSFFQLEGNGEESFRHKLKYFLNLCGGTCTVFSAFEFSRNLLRSDEKQLFKCNRQSFVRLVSSLDDYFKVVSDKIQLCKSHSWFTPSVAASFTFGDNRHQASGGGDKKPTAVVKQVHEHFPKSLTLTFVTDSLKAQGYPMSWKEFMKKFLCQKTADIGSTVETFMRQYNSQAKKSLCLSEDFVALNAPYHRNRLKLALILENRCHSCSMPNKISMKELKEQFEEIASREEIMATGRNYDNFCEFIGKFPMIFVVQGDSVRQGYRHLRFSSFFAKEKEGALPSVMNKLNYFVNMCGNDCDIRFACKFLQRHLSLKKELQLVDSDEKVLCLAQESLSGKNKSYTTGITAGNVKHENEIAGDRVAPTSEEHCGVSWPVVGHYNDDGSEHKSEHKSEKQDAKECDRVATTFEERCVVSWPVVGHYNDDGSEHKSEHKSKKQDAKECDGKVFVPTPLTGNPLRCPTALEASLILPSNQSDQRQLQFSPVEDILSSTSSKSSNHSKTKAVCDKAKTEWDAATVIAMVTEPKVDVIVEVIKNDVTLDRLIAKMQDRGNCQCIISVMHSQDALVVVDSFGVGFILPVPRDGFSTCARRRTKLCNFFTNPQIVMVTFDCMTIGRFLLERLNLPVKHVFDIKTGMHLMFSETGSESHSVVYNSVMDMCQHFGLKGPDNVNPHIIGNLTSEEDHIHLDRAELSLLVQNVATLVPAVYSWVFQKIESHKAHNALHSRTSKKLESLYAEPTDKMITSSRCETSSSLTLSHPSNESSASAPSSYSCGGDVKDMPYFVGHSTSLSTSLSQNGMIPTQRLMPMPVPQDDWFSGDLDDLAGIPSVLDTTFNQETYCLRKVEDSTIIPVPQEEAASYDSNLSNLTDELIRQYSQSNTENIIQLLTLLGDDIFTTLSSKLKDQSERTVEDLSEITLHVGRHASARLHQNIKSGKPVVVVASSKVTMSEDLKEIETKDALTGFDDENRCGVEGCLHSIRRITNRKKKLIGLTVRVALPLLGCADMMYDIALSDKSTLILGRPGVGKTTLLRELARCLSDTEGNKVVVIDTCNEIAGDCDTPHFSIGSASRLQVDSPDHQHRVIAESVKNHNPDVVIIDLVELPSDVSAIAHLRKQGIKVIAGVSGDSISSLLHDENLSQMFKIGGSDFLDDMSSLDSAGALAKSKLRPAFESLVEMKETDHWHIHDLMYTLSYVSNSQAYRVQERTRIGLNHRQPGWEQEILLREKVINPQDTFN